MESKGEKMEEEENADEDNEEEKTERKESNLERFVIELLTGFAMASICKVATQPLERMKIVMQTQPILKSHPDRKYEGMCQTALRLISEQPKDTPTVLRPATLMRGSVLNCVRYLPVQFLNFVFKGFTRRLVSSFWTPSQDSLLEGVLHNVVTGGLTGVITLSLTYPLDCLRTRITADTTTHLPRISDLWSYFGNLYDDRQFLYNGFLTSCIGIFPYRLTFLLFLTFSRRYLLSRSEDEPPSFLTMWFLSQSCSILAQYISYPIDTVRRRLQVSGTSEQFRTYDGAVDCVSKMVEEEGVGSFFKGFAPNFLRSMISAFILMFYDDMRPIIARMVLGNDQE